jgi:hypothetical protein
MKERIRKAWLEKHWHLSQITLQNARLRAGSTSENDLFLRIASEKYTMPRAAWNNGETCKMSPHGDTCFRCIRVCKISQFTELSILGGRKGTRNMAVASYSGDPRFKSRTCWPTILKELHPPTRLRYHNTPPNRTILHLCENLNVMIFRGNRVSEEIATYILKIQKILYWRIRQQIIFKIWYLQNCRVSFIRRSYSSYSTQQDESYTPWSRMPVNFLSAPRKTLQYCHKYPF